jgi:DNA-directed RNA polymerase subunit M/transcription elongation factor TFIIS
MRQAKFYRVNGLKIEETHGQQRKPVKETEKVTRKVYGKNMYFHQKQTKLLKK